MTSCLTKKHNAPHWWVRTGVFWVVVVTLSALLSGCGGVLPRESTKYAYPWSTFDGVKTAYDKITVYETQLDELIALGFDPANTPNVTVLSYLDVVNQFSPLLEKADLPNGVQECIRAQEGCTAYVANITNISRKRVGNTALDLLGFKRETHITGWRFESLFVIVNDTVVYKKWRGTPAIEQSENSVKPLGPVQSLSGVLPY